MILAITTDQFFAPASLGELQLVTIGGEQVQNVVYPLYREAGGDPVRVLFIMTHAATKKLLAQHGEHLVLGPAFFGSKEWKARPNSTTRLFLGNLQALSKLEPGIRLTLWTDGSMTDDLARAIDESDVVVFNQFAGDESFSFLNRFCGYWISRRPEAKLIFGTEGTLRNAIASGKLDDESFRLMVLDAVLLRHTAKGELFIAKDPEFAAARVQEFELPLDVGTVRAASGETPISHRNKILFVAAPEGRTTKNNEMVEDIVEELSARPDEFGHLDVEVLRPPYQTLDYWRLLSQTRYIIFTSLSETFSYVYNDARAAGVVCFMHWRMYANRLGSAFQVDSYPEVGIRYVTIDELFQRMADLENSPEQLSHQSDRAVRVTLDNFGIDRVARNWSKLLRSEPLNDRSILILGEMERTLSKSAIRTLAAKHGCQFVMYSDNLGNVCSEMQGGSLELGDDCVLLSDWRTQVEDEYFRSRHLAVDYEGKIVPLREPVSLDDGRIFYNFLFRVNKIGQAFVSPALKDGYMFDALSEARIFGTLDTGAMPILLRLADLR